MVNWYYVVGSERVGPISEEALKVLYINDEVTADTYVWKKGFANWEKIRDITELVSFLEEPLDLENDIHVEQSPELYIDFSWEGVDENEEVFFIKTGKDRNLAASSLYGPYSFVELQEALSDNRINLRTLIYSPGMQSWMTIADTPLNTSLNSDLIQEIVTEPNPAYFVINKNEKYLIALVKNATELIGDKSFTDCVNSDVKATLYVGNELKAKDIDLKFSRYDQKSQMIDFEMNGRNQEIESIIKNYA